MNEAHKSTKVVVFVVLALLVAVLAIALAAQVDAGGLWGLKQV